MKFPFHPTLNYLAVIPFEEEDYIQSGEIRIYIPQSSKKALTQGKVVDKGPDCEEKISVGDIVIWPLHQEERVKVDRDMFFLIKEDFIICHATEAELANLQKP